MASVEAAEGAGVDRGVVCAIVPVASAVSASRMRMEIRDGIATEFRSRILRAGEDVG
jgi:hypothetical protein